MRAPLAVALKTADSPDTPVLIEAEAGSGAAALARLIHAHTPRAREGAFVVARCPGMSENAIDADLFGPLSEPPASGSSGAEERPRIEHARGGTLYIDEIALLGLATQVRLARLIGRDGADYDRAAAFRLVASSSVDLGERVRGRRFRLELLEHLSVIRIRIPPLRERPDELIRLAEHFLGQRAERLGAKQRVLSDGAREKLLRHSFPGNVDELRAVIERALILDGDDVLSADAISFETTLAAGFSSNEPGPDLVSQHAAQILLEHKRPPTLAELERHYLIWLLREAGGNRTVVARQMGVSYPTVVKKIADYDIDIRPFVRRDRHAPTVRR